MTPIPFAEAPDGVINRQPELEWISQEIDLRFEGPRLANSVINVYGPKSIGKSTFLRRLLKPNLEQHQPPLPHALIDFDPARGGRPFVDEQGQMSAAQRATFIEVLARQLGGDAPAFDALKGVLMGYHDAHRGSPATADQRFEDLVYAFNYEFIPGLILGADETPQPVVILLDSADRLAAEALQWLQQAIQSPTTATGHVLYVVASDHRLEYDPFFLRNRYAWLPIGAFQPDDVREQIEAQAPMFVVLDDDIYRLSYGMPGVTQRVVARLKQLAGRYPDVTAKELFRQHEGELVREVETWLIEYLSDIKDPKGEKDTLLTDSMRLLSPIRQFNISIVDQLLPDLLRDYYDEPKPVEPMLLIRKLQRTRHVAWDNERDGYVIESPLRQQLARVLRYSNRELYEQAHKQALAKFNAWQELVPDKRIDYLIEALYHQAALLLLDADDDFTAAAATLQAMLRAAVNRFYAGSNDDHTSVTLRDELRQKLESDADLTRMLGQERLQEVLQVVDERTARAEASGDAA